MKARKQPKRVNYKDIALELQKRVIWALKFMKCPGAGCVAFMERDSNGNITNVNGMKHWTDWFADGAEMLGNCKVDRELVGLSQKEVAKILKAREAKKK